ncbi:MAG: chorismate synthase [Candidatus Izemoplasmatales bacterium]|jgi:chorismate synthase|nr:chorismate synthase [Candidatus Izemoplasmatales bacterium]
MNKIGHNISITFFGESHGEYIGVVIDQFPAGINIDLNLIEKNLKKRRPQSSLSTSRIEPDDFEIISGYKNGFTTGAALTVLVKNKNVKSDDYSYLENIPRPSHADYPANIKYSNYNDKAGGGIFSGRLTVLWIIVGSICQQILEKHNILVGSHIESIKNIYDNSFDKLVIEDTILKALNEMNFPLINLEIKAKMEEIISKSVNAKDSLGGTIESAIINMPIGVGEPLFLSIESYLSNLLFSIPGIKGIEFGEGFNLSRLTGSEANDQYTYEDEKIVFSSNNNGGILGGLSTGQPIILRLSVKPTSSIPKPQNSINLKTEENVVLEIKGRHDPQIVSRAVHVVNSVLNFAILDLLLFSSKDWFN